MWSGETKFSSATRLVSNPDRDVSPRTQPAILTRPRSGVIIWNLFKRPTARFRDLGADYHATRMNTERRTRNYVTQLMVMGYRVTLEPAA
jgi:hypothetical protein